MPRGKKSDSLTIYKVMLSYVETRNYSETARKLDMPESTVRKIIDDNREKEEFAKLCEEKRDEFVEKASRIIEKTTTLLERRIDTALEQQNELDKILDDVMDLKNKDANYKRKKALANKIEALQLNRLPELTTAIGTMFDKRALSKGENTSNTKLDVNITVVE